MLLSRDSGASLFSVVLMTLESLACMVTKVPKGKGSHLDGIGVREGGIPVFCGLTSVLLFESFFFGFDFFFLSTMWRVSVEAPTDVLEFSGEAWEGLWESTGIFLLLEIRDR